ncbi:MAG: methyltransferase domain-containing protein, partial [Hyphomicrobiales bacterium]|nr:methyltransferase domain-containing protein [Hyphomicrobiales bacterium]
MKCRHCNTPLVHDFVNLGSAPPSNAYLSEDMLSRPEVWYPLRVKYCGNCWLVQTEDFAERETFFSEDYAYFSSMSASWLDHAEQYARVMTDRFAINSESMVVEIASNDGYLLKNFQANDVPCLGVEPTLACAQAAKDIGIETVIEFFGVELAQKLIALGHRADLMAANNVLAHVPDINDFVAGFRELLKEQGVATFEFPHFLNLVQQNQF